MHSTCIFDAGHSQRHQTIDGLTWRSRPEDYSAIFDIHVTQEYTARERVETCRGVKPRAEAARAGYEGYRYVPARPYVAKEDTGQR